METNQLEVLAHIVLPSEILDYFSVVGVKQTPTETHIHLDGLMNSTLSHDVHFESKDFMEAVSVTDFPIRDHKILPRIRRRRRTGTRTSKSFSIPVNLDVVCKSTRYSKGFGAFLRRCMEMSPVTCRTLEEFYHVDGHTFEKQYREMSSGFMNWEQSEHADEWILFPEDIGSHLARMGRPCPMENNKLLSPTVTGYPRGSLAAGQ